MLVCLLFASFSFFFFLRLSFAVSSEWCNELFVTFFGIATNFYYSIPFILWKGLFVVNISVEHLLV